MSQFPLLQFEWPKHGNRKPQARKVVSRKLSRNFDEHKKNIDTKFDEAIKVFENKTLTLSHEAGFVSQNLILVVEYLSQTLQNTTS
jgi:hypothetical protein